MKFTSSIVDTLVDTIREKDKLNTTIGILFPSTTQSKAITDSFQGKTTSMERSVNLVNATKHFAFMKDGLLWTLSNPAQVTDHNGSSLTIGNMSPNLGECIPCKIPTSTFYGRVVTLEQKQVVTHFNFPKVETITPEDVPSPESANQLVVINDEGEEEGGPILGSARLNLPWLVESDHTAPVFTAVPVFFPLPNGLVIPPGGHPIDEPFPSIESFPIFKSWIVQMKYSKTMNNGKSFNRGGPLFVSDTVLEAFPNNDMNYPFVESIECNELVLLNPTSAFEKVHFDAVNSVESEYQVRYKTNNCLRHNCMRPHLYRDIAKKSPTFLCLTHKHFLLALKTNPFTVAKDYRLCSPQGLSSELQLARNSTEDTS